MAAWSTHNHDELSARQRSAKRSYPHAYAASIHMSCGYSRTRWSVNDHGELSGWRQSAKGSYPHAYATCIHIRCG